MVGLGSFNLFVFMVLFICASGPIRGGGFAGILGVAWFLLLRFYVISTDRIFTAKTDKTGLILFTSGGGTHPCSG